MRLVVLTETVSVVLDILSQPTFVDLTQTLFVVFCDLWLGILYGDVNFFARLELIGEGGSVEELVEMKIEDGLDGRLTEVGRRGEGLADGLNMLN